MEPVAADLASKTRLLTDTPRTDKGKSQGTNSNPIEGVDFSAVATVQPAREHNSHSQLIPKLATVEPGKKGVSSNQLVFKSVDSSYLRVAGKGVTLPYNVPNRDESCVCLNFLQEDLEEEVCKWRNSHVIYMVGVQHTLKYMKQMIAKIWGQFANPVLHQHDNDFFIARFRSEVECERVLTGGPYSIKNHPMILQRWSAKFDLRRLKF